MRAFALVWFGWWFLVNVVLAIADLWRIRGAPSVTPADTAWLVFEVVVAIVCADRFADYAGWL